MPGCALADLARSSGGAKVRVSCRRADSPSSGLSVMSVGLLFLGRASILPDEAAARSARAGPVPQLEAFERERRRHGRPDEGIAPKRTGPLPDAGLDDGLRSLPGGDVAAEDDHFRWATGRLADKLERIAVIEVPQLGGVDPMRRGDFSLEQEVVDGAGRGSLAFVGRRLPGAAVPPSLGMRRKAEGFDDRFARSHGCHSSRQRVRVSREAATVSECSGAPPKSAPSAVARFMKKWPSCSQVKPMPPNDWSDSRHTRCWQSSLAALAMATAAARCGVSSAMAATAK